MHTHGMLTGSSVPSASVLGSSFQPTTSMPITTTCFGRRRPSTRWPIACSVRQTSSCELSRAGRPSREARTPRLWIRRASLPPRCGARSGPAVHRAFRRCRRSAQGASFRTRGVARVTSVKAGTFIVAGRILPAYEKFLAPMLAHPSVRVVGHRTDVADLMRESDVLLLPSLEEGSALVCNEALGCGCVPLVSDATSGTCADRINSLVHVAGDVDSLSEHISTLFHDTAMLRTLRANGLAGAGAFTWSSAGRRLADIYSGVAARGHDGVRADRTSLARRRQRTVAARTGVGAGILAARAEALASKADCLRSTRAAPDRRWLTPGYRG